MVNGVPLLDPQVPLMGLAANVPAMEWSAVTFATVSGLVVDVTKPPVPVQLTK